MSTAILFVIVCACFGLVLKFVKNRIFGVLICLCLIAIFPFLFLQARLLDFPNKEPEKKIAALVLGAGIRNNETPTQILKLRLDKAIELYKANKLNSIIVSGDNSFEDHNEPRVMKNYLIQNGVPFDFVREDFGGRRTMDSCYRTKNFFEVQEAYVVTQQFHLPRSVFLCNDVKLKVYPVAASDTGPSTVIWGYLREIPAAWGAIRDSIWFRPQVGSDGSEKTL
jgi:vancomycin permeability regulator SanA